MVIDREDFIRESILESLMLDHENYDLLFEEVRDICGQNSMIINEMDFKGQLYSLINEEKVRSCLYNDEAHDLLPQGFDESRLKEYWFCKSLD